MFNIKVNFKKGIDFFKLEIYADGEIYKPVRSGTFPKLGKRYICGQPLVKRDGDRVISVEYEYGSTKINNYPVFLGCGTEVLITKAPTGDPSMPECCGMPMCLKEPKPLPSSD
ncbi:MAG: hypothetical protein NT129_00265 [Candidatus Aenigmarchaeota archaeon]|nr:hypothetical protein [Candidatus Aenigmarchaeota archaeon]